jgi:hypothetical protein
MRHAQGLAVAFLGAWAATASAGTHVVTFGGGPPSHNQISLERNVEYFRRVLDGVGLGTARHDVYFGDAGARNSVQYRLPESDDQQLARALGMILWNNSEADVRYEKVSLPGLAGPSSVANVEAWFEVVGRSLPAGERLVFYFTGHGGPDSANRDGPRNTTLIMPGYPGALTVQQFVAQLDKLSPQVDTTLVMVQCYSGGFANVIYNEGDPAKGFARHPRAGFFSTIASRTAAGCTPDVSEEDYHEFSTSFFEAILGRTRTGRTVSRPDYDGDGRTSFDEAFTHVLLTSDTIDIPTTTSDRLLRDKSRFAMGDADAARGLLPRDAPWSTVLDAASPSQRAALEGLSQALGLDGEDRLTQARAKAGELDPGRNRGRGRGPGQRRGNQDQGPTAQAPAPGGRGPGQGFNLGRLRAALADRWPELSVPFHPDAPRIIAEERDEIRRVLEAQPDFAALSRRVARRTPDPEALARSPERRWVKHRRLLERADSVILGANLPRLDDAEALGVYRRLLELEHRVLAPDAPAPVAEGQPAGGS